MTKQKSKNRALLMSALGLFMCISMLVGSTFAWFSDDITSVSNKIKAGTLQIALEYSTDNGVTWNDAENKTLDFIAADGRQDILWEPGCTYKLPLIRVRNNGDLALKYEITLNGATGDQELLDAIEFTADGNPLKTYIGTLSENGDTSNSIQIAGHMKWDAGNDCQGKTINGIGIKVYATQYAYEKDSVDNQYDANATFPVTSFEKLKKALENGESVSLANDIVLNEQLMIPTGKNVTLDLNGYDIEATQQGTSTYGMFNVYPGATLNVRGNGNVTLRTNVTSGISACIFQNDGTLNIYGGNYEANQAASVSGLGAVIAVIDNCPYNTDAVVNIYGGTFAVTGEGAINIIRNWPIKANTATATLNIYNGTFKANPSVSTTYLWNKNDSNDSADGNKLASKINFYGGEYEQNVVYEDYQGQEDIYIANGVNIAAYSGNN